MKIAIFSCHNSIWPWGLFLSYFGEAFKQQGYEIDFVTCNQAVDYSTAVGLNPRSSAGEKAKVRARSKRNTNWLTRGFGFNHVRLEKYLQPDAQKLLFDKDIEEKISIYALYETILTYKTYNNYSPEMIEMKNAFYKGNRIIYTAAERYFRYSKPDLTFVWNALYSFNSTWNLAAEKENIPTYWIHAGSNRGYELRSIMFGEKNYFPYIIDQKERWGKAEADIKLTPTDTKVIAGHLGMTISGNSMFNYSKPKQSVSFKKLKNIEARKLIVLTTSSEDELIASKAVGTEYQEEGHLFQNQVEWIRFLLDKVSKLNDPYIVLRVHPREFPNQRDSKHSESSQFYFSLYEKYKNSGSIHINLPQDNISLYDLFEEADLVLNAFSTAGEEAGLLGIPVLSAFQNYCNYPRNLEPVYSNRTEYLDAMQKEIKAGWSERRALRFLKWRVFSTLRSEINLSHEYGDIVSSRWSYKEFFPARRMIKWIKSEPFDQVFQYFDLDNKHGESLDKNSALGDREAIKQYFELVYDMLYKEAGPVIPNTLQNQIRNFLINTDDPDEKFASS